jgi:hypothetical protein
MAKEVGQIIIGGIPVMVTLGLRLGMAYLRFKRKAKKAAAIYQKELLAGGMDGESARRLTELYLESSRLVHMGIKGAMSGGPAKWRERAAAASR